MKEHLRRNFSLYILLTNILCAIGVAAFAILGVLSAYMSAPVLVGNAIVFGLLYAVGKFGNEQLEDLPKVDEFEKGYPHV